MDMVFQFLAERPIVLLFLLLGVGAALGTVRVAGVSLVSPAADRARTKNLYARGSRLVYEIVRFVPPSIQSGSKPSRRY